MTAFARTQFFSTNTTLEAHLAHAIRAYRATTGGRAYAERSEVDQQPFCFYQVANVASGITTSSRFLIARLAIPLSENGDATNTAIWAQTLELPNSLVLPAGFAATS